MRKRETDRTKANCPRYTLSDRMVSLVAEITEVATHLEMRESAIDPLLRKKNRLKTIHSSLAIEQNTLTLKQVTDIIDGKRVFGPPKEIEEVKNAKAAYYRAISNADKTGDARMFIEFMLAALRDALASVKRSVGKSTGKSVGKGCHWEVVNGGGK